MRALASCSFFPAVLIGIAVNAQAIELGHVFDWGHSIAPFTAATDRSGVNVDAVLEKISEQENTTLPKMVNETVRFDKVAAQPGKRFVRQYTLLNNLSIGANKRQFAESMLPTLKSVMCSDKSLTMYFKYGVSVIQQYQSQDGQEIGSIQVVPSDCHPAA